MRVLITGASGFIGSALVERLLGRGDEVTAFTRRPDDSRLRRDVRWLGWDPRSAGGWQQQLGGYDGIVHLAGETAVGRRYTPELRREILESRAGLTTRLVDGLRQTSERPRVLVSASGVSFYGKRDDATPLDESAPVGDEFLSEVCVAWEAAAAKVTELGTRAVSARIGFVLGRGGGALQTLVPIFKAFAGGPIGSGRQWVSWIHLADIVGGMLHALDDAELSGPVNFAAPNAVTNAELSKTLAKVLGRPALLPAPAFALRALFGDGAEPLLSGQRVVPRALLERGYVFRFTDLESALRSLLP